MPRYVGLITWTEQGIRNVKDTTQRAQQTTQLIEQMGGRLEQLFWTQGRYDLVGILNAPDEETLAAMMLRISSLGAVRTETMRAFDADEMGRILQRLG